MTEISNIRLAALVARRLPAALYRHAAATWRASAPGRKPLGDLTLDDLIASPIWEEVSTAKTVAVNEGIYRPRPDLDRYDPAVGSGFFVVLTRFSLADGTEMFGYSTPNSEGDVGYMTPAIITDDGCVPFWFVFDEEPPGDFARPLYEKLGRTRPDDVFPIEFEALVPSDTPGAGVITAFQGLLYRNRKFTEVSRT